MIVLSPSRPALPCCPPAVSSRSVIIVLDLRR